MTISKLLIVLLHQIVLSSRGDRSIELLQLPVLAWPTLSLL